MINESLQSFYESALMHRFEKVWKFNSVDEFYEVDNSNLKCVVALVKDSIKLKKKVYAEKVSQNKIRFIEMESFQFKRHLDSYDRVETVYYILFESI